MRSVLSSAARYGIELDASLITGIDPPSDIDSALAAIQYGPQRRIFRRYQLASRSDSEDEQSKRAVEIEPMRVQAEVEPLLRVGRLKALKKTGGSRSLWSTCAM